METIRERWKSIPGCEGRWEVSNRGYYRRIGTRERSRGTVNDRGYLIVHITDNEGRSRMFSMHRLVAEAFIPNPTRRPYIDHIDGDTLNNRVDNLRWVFPKENSQNYVTRIRAMEPSLFRDNWSGPKPCYATRPDGVTVLYKTIRAAAEGERVSTISISRCLKGQQKACKGIVFEKAYLEQLTLF